MFAFDFCNALPVRARVGSGTITAIYYCYYYFKDNHLHWYGQQKLTAKAIKQTQKNT